MTYTGDITDDPNSDVPRLAHLFYHEYGSAALQLADQAVGKVMDFLPELFPGVPKEEAIAFRQVLILERIIKFCQIAENLGAIAVAFKSSFDDEKQEILGIFNTLTVYKVGWVVDFYEHIASRELHFIAKFVGYPLLDLQKPGARKFLEISCRNIQRDLTAIGNLYEELRPLYDAYKHGYRVSFGTDNKTQFDVIVYVDIFKKQKVLLVSDEFKKNIFEKVALAFHILNVIFQAHRERTKFEAAGGREGPINIHIYRDKLTDPKPTAEDLLIRYPTRGERMRKDVEEGDKIYNDFKTDLEKNHMSSFVAIDIDERKVILVDKSFEKIKEAVESRGSSSRVRIRKVGHVSRTGLDIY